MNIDSEEIVIGDKKDSNLFYIIVKYLVKLLFFISW